jgi:hypothetical protein
METFASTAEAAESLVSGVRREASLVHAMRVFGLPTAIRAWLDWHSSVWPPSQANPFLIGLPTSMVRAEDVAGTTGSRAQAWESGTGAVIVAYVDPFLREHGAAVPVPPAVAALAPSLAGGLPWSDPAAHRYVTAADVWSFLKVHPRVPR